jgi:hypothetical protein
VNAWLSNSAQNFGDADQIPHFFLPWTWGYNPLEQGEFSTCHKITYGLLTLCPILRDSVFQGERLCGRQPRRKIERISNMRGRAQWERRRRYLWQSDYV